MDLAAFAYAYYSTVGVDALSQQNVLDYMGIQTAEQTASSGTLDFASSPPHALFVDTAVGATLNLATAGAASDTRVMLCTRETLTLHHVVEDRDESFAPGCALLRVTSEGAVEIEHVRSHADQAAFEFRRE